MSTRPTLLFVDDEPNILRSLRRTFRGLDYNIIFANSGAEGLEVLDDEPVDLIISDMRMPEMTGAQFLEKACEKYPNTIRFLLTGYADMQSTIDAVNKGKIHKYLNKPWDDTEIKIAVQQALELAIIRKERDDLLTIVQTQNEQLTGMNKNLEAKVDEKTKDLVKAMTAIKATNNELKSSYISIVKTFSSLIEMKKELRTTSARAVSELAKAIATELEINTETIQQTMVAAMLYKVGKVSLSDEILSTPYHDLDDKRKRQFIQHPVIGESILMGIKPLHDAAKLIRHQLERFDGKGTPDGLQGKEISVAQSCLNIAIDYCELKGGNLYHVKMPAKEAADWIVQGSGKRYSPDAVMAFQMAIAQHNQKREVKEFACAISGLKKGMVLSRDIMTNGGMLLLSKGQVLDAQTIDKLAKYEHTLKTVLKTWVCKPQ